MFMERGYFSHQIRSLFSKLFSVLYRIWISYLKLQLINLFHVCIGTTFHASESICRTFDYFICIIVYINPADAQLITNFKMVHRSTVRWPRNTQNITMGCWIPGKKIESKYSNNYRKYIYIFFFFSINLPVFGEFCPHISDSFPNNPCTILRIEWQIPTPVPPYCWNFVSMRRIYQPINKL